MNRQKFISSFIILNFVLIAVLAFPPLDSTFSERIHRLDISTQSGISSENSIPTMEYYPCKYRSFGNGLLYSPLELPVMVLAQDPDGIDTVRMFCRYKEETIWNESILDQTLEDDDVYNGSLLFKAKSSSIDSHDPITMEVFYIANDTLNNSLQSTIMAFTMEFGIVTVDGVAPLYETPDLWYLVNSTGHSVTWQTQVDITYFHPFTLYTLQKEGYLLEQEQWEGELTINVDGLSLGDHLYELEVACGAWPTNDNVTVHVVEVLPTGVYTGSVGPKTRETGTVNFAGPGLIISVGFIGCIVIILIAKKVISQQS
ncbi:MAG: hypothetical protein RTV72_15365 [Candidatus Thorarchaeota archaeon]